MSAKAQSYVFEHSPYRGVAYTVHIVLGDLSNDQNDNKVWISHDNVAQKARTTRQTVQKTFTDMCKDGYLELLEDNSKRYRPNVYRFLMPVQPQATPSAITGDTQCNPSLHLVQSDVALSAITGDTNSIEHKHLTQDNTKNTTDDLASQDGFFDTNQFIPPITSKASDYTPEFEEMWKIYPRHVGKGAAWKVWKRQIKEGKADPQKMIQAAKNYADHCKRERTEETYIKYPSTFFALGKDWWLDWVVVKVNWKDPRQNVNTDNSEREGGIVDPKELYRQRQAEKNA